MEELINKVFEIVKDSLFAGIDSKYFDLIEKNYKNNTKEMIEKLAKVRSDIDEVILDYAQKEKQMLERKSTNSRLHFYVVDQNYLELDKLSCQAYTYAFDKFNSGNNTISKEEALNNIEIMNRLFQNICDFNIDFARMKLSEAITDFEYACGNDKLISLRLAHNVIENKRNEQIIK